MMIVELTGNHYEMGRQHAQKLLQYRAAISDLLEAHRKKIETYPRGAISEIMEEMRDVLSLRSSQTLDMIHGIADGFGLSRNDLLSMMIGSYYEDKLTSLEEKGCHEDGCTTWAYSGERGSGENILLAKNRDYLISHRGLQVVFRCKPDKGDEYFSINSIGACNVFSSGMNRQGLAIADTRVPSFDAGPGLPRFSLMMHTLENFKYVAEADTREIFDHPLHPYTQALLSAVPVVEKADRRSRIILEGTPPSPIDPPSGCRFHTRCFLKKGDICEEEEPAYRFSKDGHKVACHLY